MTFQRLLRLVFSRRTSRLVSYDLARLRTRMKRCWDKDVIPDCSKLHLGCGERRVRGWLNSDVSGSQYDVDLACGRLPWKAECFEAVVSQHVIEHLELFDELLPLLCEVHRILKPGGSVWLSCPDIRKVCQSYVSTGMDDLLEDRLTRWPKYSLRGAPSRHLINELFHQQGEHLNLFDFELLSWALYSCKFDSVVRIEESDLLKRFPEFPARNDDRQSLYVCATRS